MGFLFGFELEPTHEELLKLSCHHDVESLMLPAVTEWDARMENGAELRYGAKS